MNLALVPVQRFVLTLALGTCTAQAMTARIVVQEQIKVIENTPDVVSNAPSSGRVQPDAAEVFVEPTGGGGWQI